MAIRDPQEEVRRTVEAARRASVESERTIDSARRAVERSLTLLDRNVRHDRPDLHEPDLAPAPLLAQVDQILTTEELDRRPPRVPDHRAEAAAYQELARTFEARPEIALQRTVEIARTLCGAATAGVSVQERHPEHGTVFRWRATAGALRPHQNAALPADASPCALVVERGETLLMEWPEWAFPAVALRPSIVEALLTPVYENDRIVGTLWVAKHGVGRPFDAEDRRVLQGLMRFVAPAWRLTE